MRQKKVKTRPRARAPSKASVPSAGYVDTFGYSSAAGGWLFNGWIARPTNLEHSEPVEFSAHYEKSAITGRALLAFYERGDLDDQSVGVIAFLPSSSRVTGSLQYISFVIGSREFQSRAGHFTSRLADQEIVERIRHNLTNHGFANRNREHFLALTQRGGFAGTDTLAALSQPVLLEIDEAIVCPPSGLLLKGWLLSAPGVVRQIRVRSGPLAAPLDLAHAIPVTRADVIDAIDPQYGFSDARCGFVLFVPGVVSSGDSTYLEVELDEGEVGFKTFQLSKRRGIDAIQRTLGGIEIPYGGIDAAFDRTLGPAVASINYQRRQQAVAVHELAFGHAATNPTCTVIIPLYGRVDFLEYQMALFSRDWNAAAVELLYVLDDPAKQRELELLARSAHERFGVPFRLLMLQSNLGFAAANNVGLRAARGDFVCFLNSDVFPITAHAIERLMQRLQQRPDIGILGARLLFEDGSVQHEGCYYRPLSEFGQWNFIEHLNKGRRPDGEDGVVLREAITGACMMLRRDLAHDLGGFDEDFILGDFEDSDLCLKAKARGLHCAVDLGTHMYHLERKSQTSPHQSWRMNLTLYNAWIHQRRWFTEAKSVDA